MSKKISRVAKGVALATILQGCQTTLVSDSINGVKGTENKDGSDTSLLDHTKNRYERGIKLQWDGFKGWFGPSDGP
jgi:hypothetical protein